MGKHGISETERVARINRIAAVVVAVWAALLFVVLPVVLG